MGILMQLGVADPVPTLNSPAVSHMSQQGFWGCAEAGEKEVFCLEWLAVAATCCHNFNDPARAEPLLADVVWRLFGSQGPGDVSAMADLVIDCQERDLAFSLELTLDLEMQRPLVGLDSQEEVGALLLELLKKRFLGVQGVRLDEQALEIQLAKQRFRHSPFMVLSSGVAGLADGHPHCRRVDGGMGNERRTPTGGGLNRTPHGFAVVDKLTQFRSATRDLGDRPITDGRTKHRNVHVLEEITES
jgi:hypothetical protein